VAQVTGPVEVPTTNAFFVSPPGAVLSPCSPAPGAPNCEQVNYFFGNDLGNNAYSDGHSENYQATLGIDFKIFNGWHLGFDGTAGKDHDRDLQTQELNNGNLAAALASGNPTTALNVFGGANSAAVLNSVFANRFYAPGDTGEQVFEGKLDGSLFHMPGGDVRAAVGGQWQHDELLYGINSGVPDGADLIIRQNLNRHSVSGYAEVLIPFFGPDNAVPGMQKLELDVAGRYENYSDFGSTSHPKIGLNWSPVDGVTAHASYGTSFRAPLLSELVGPLQGVFVQTYSDPISPTGTSVGYTLGGGNLKLQPETATTYSFGVDYQPIRDAKFSLNYFNIDYRNQIWSYLSDLTILQQSEQLGSLITRCPSAQCTSLINQYVAPGPVFGPILANPSVFVGNQPHRRRIPAGHRHHLQRRRQARRARRLRPCKHSRTRPHDPRRLRRDRTPPAVHPHHRRPTQIQHRLPGPPARRRTRYLRLRRRTQNLRKKTALLPGKGLGRPAGSADRPHQRQDRPPGHAPRP
jgi:iron complex outermembrane receptor protein